MNTTGNRRLGGAQMIVACVALFVALSGTAVAAKNLITGKEIAKSTITDRFTKVNAINAPKLMSAATKSRLSGMASNEIRPTKSTDNAGVCQRGCTKEKVRETGPRPFRPIT